MKINKLKVLEILSKTVIQDAFKFPINPDVFSPILDTALAPYYSKLLEIGILDKKDNVDIELLEKQIKQFFQYTPVLRLPISQGSIVIKEEMLEKFIKRLKDFCNSQREVKIEDNILTS